MSTPLQPIDAARAAQFWARAVAAGVADPATPKPDVEQFGDSLELANELIGLVVDESKRATASALADYAHDGVPPPEPGRLTIVADGHGRALAVLQTIDVRIGPLSSVDDEFTWDEGEGDRTRDWWLAAHQEFFRRPADDRSPVHGRPAGRVRALRRRVPRVTSPPQAKGTDTTVRSGWCPPVARPATGNSPE